MSQQINLYNAQLLYRKQDFSLQTMLQGVGLIAAGLLAFYAYEQYQVQALKAQTQELTKTHADVQGKLLAFTSDFSQKQAKKMLDAEVKKAEAELQAQGRLMEMLKDGSIGNTMGYSEYMRAFARQAIQGMWMTGFDISGNNAQMSLRGGLLNPELLPSFIKRLNQEKVMRGKKFSSLQMQQNKVEPGKPAGRTYVEFTLVTEHAGEEK